MSVSVCRFINNKKNLFYNNRDPFKFNQQVLFNILLHSTLGVGTGQLNDKLASLSVSPILLLTYMGECMMMLMTVPNQMQKPSHLLCIVVRFLSTLCLDVSSNSTQEHTQEPETTKTTKSKEYCKKEDRNLTFLLALSLLITNANPKTFETIY